MSLLCRCCALLLALPLLAGARTRLVLPVPGAAPLTVDLYLPSPPGGKGPGALCLLLHGGFGRASDFADFGLEALADQTRMVFVCPEGGGDGFLACGPGQPGSPETLLGVLLPAVAQRFPGVPSSRPWVVAGVSTGGLAALRLGFEHPDRFSLVAALSGTVEVGAWTAADEACLSQPLRASLDRSLGPPGSLQRRSWNPEAWLAGLPGRERSLPFLFLACGLDDPFLASNQRLALLLARSRVPHEYRQAPGRHDTAFWKNQLRAALECEDRRSP